MVTYSSGNNAADFDWEAIRIKWTIEILLLSVLGRHLISSV